MLLSNRSRGGRISSSRRGGHDPADAAAEIGKSMTTMIDVVFLLLIFFVFTARFVSLEESLAAHLPKDRDASRDSIPTVVPAEVLMDISWREGRATASARVVGPYVSGDLMVEFDSRQDRRLGYAVPSIDAVDSFLRECAHEHGSKMPVTVHFESGVPWQVIVNAYDSCARIGLENVTIAAEEVD